MPQLNWNVIAVSLLYAAATGIFNLILGHKSQVEAWAQSNPKLAAVLKFTRALGLDPWNLFSAALLLLKGKLPAAQQANSPIAKVEQAKADAKLRAEAVDDTVRIGPLAVLLLAALSLHQAACHSAPPCSEDKLRAIDAAYLADVAKQCLPQYNTAAECPAYEGLRAKHSKALHEACN